jgi:hypothetical protein
MKTYATPHRVFCPFGRSYSYWEFDGETFPRTLFPAGTVLKRGQRADLHTGEVYSKDNSRSLISRSSHEIRNPHNHLAIQGINRT